MSKERKINNGERNNNYKCLVGHTENSDTCPHCIQARLNILQKKHDLLFEDKNGWRVIAEENLDNMYSSSKLNDYEHRVIAKFLTGRTPLLDHRDTLLHLRGVTFGDNGNVMEQVDAILSDFFVDNGFNEIYEALSWIKYRCNL